MKRILSLLVFVVCIGPVILAQDIYCIHEFTGNVEYKKALSSEPWQPVAKGLELRNIDSLRIPEGATARVMHMRTRKVYDSQEKAVKTNVFFFVQEAKDADARRISKGVMTEIYPGQKKKADIHEMKMVGASARGSIQSGDSLKLMAEMFAWIGAQACSGKQSPKVEGFVFKKNEVFGELDFIYENHTDKNYCINVLHINKLTNNVSLCYVTTYKGSGTTSCPIVPSGYCQCGMEIYFPASENDVYVMVATELEYDTNEMDIELARHPINTAQKNDLDIKYMW